MFTFPSFFLFQKTAEMRANMKFKKIFFTSIFILSSVLFSNFVSACINPSFYDQDGWYISPFGGWLEIDGRSASGSWMDYTLYVRNSNNNKYLTVSLKPSNGIKNYIKPESIVIAPGALATMNLHTWVDGTSSYPYAHGMFSVSFMCDDGGGQFIHPYFNAYVIGKGINPPPESACDSNIDGCYEPGMYRSYYCEDNNPVPQYKTLCIESCCKAYGGKEAFCSYDKRRCISPNSFPEPTEGKIAMVCQSKNCNTKGEKNVIMLFRYLGWDVTNKTYKEWTANEISNYDMIACSQPAACKAAFNSEIYNSHFLNKKPFLEISTTTSAFAALNFNYINKSSGVSKKENIFITSSDPIVSSYSGLAEVIGGSRSIRGIKENYLTQKVVNLANIGDPYLPRATQASPFFKVDEAVDHGRYAFIGFFSDVTVGDLTYDGEQLIKNTLGWLKYGNTFFGGTNPTFHTSGKLAYICRTDKCDYKNDVSVITWLRENGYYVEGKPQKFWNASSLSGFNAIVCSNSKSCTFKTYSDIYNAHTSSGMGFIEIPDTGVPLAANVFGYTNAKRVLKKSMTEINSTNILVAPIGPVQVLNKKTSIFGVDFTNINSATSLAKIGAYDSSAIFIKDMSGSRGRYAYIGYPGNKFDYLSEKGKEIILRMVNWVDCGNAAGC